MDGSVKHDVDQPTGGIEMNLSAIIQSLESGNFNSWVNATIRDLKELESEIKKNERLRASHAELLAACESAEKYINEAEYESNSSNTLGKLEAAIANAQPSDAR